MKLFEYEAKGILKNYGIVIPEGGVASSPDEAEDIAREIGKPVAIKSQVLVAGRGKSGGIAFARDAAGAREAASKLIGKTVKGTVVGSVLVEEQLDIKQEFYASVAIDSQAKTYVMLASTSGGVDIEQVAEVSPDRIARYRVDPLSGFSEHDAESVVSRLSLGEADVAEFVAVLRTLYRVAMDYDAELVEINPLVRAATNEFKACDARIIVDDNALFRHPEFQDRSRFTGEDSTREAEARKVGLAYVDLDGDIGVIGNGAGLVMATLDLVNLFGGKPANFLDIGGGAQAETMKSAVALVISKPEVRAVLINIFGGIVRCDRVAQGIIDALSDLNVSVPVVVRLAGTNADIAARMLRESPLEFIVADDLRDGAVKVVAALK